MEETPDSMTGTESSANDRKKTFKKLILRFSDKTSMQGVGYIRSARLSCSRITWTLITIGSVVAMSYHVGCIIAQYRSWPKQTVISLGFNKLELPDITICNLNPIRDSKVKQLKNAKKLQDFLAKTDKETQDFWTWAKTDLPDAGENTWVDYDSPPADNSPQTLDNDTTDEYINPESDDEYVTHDASNEYMDPETGDEYVIPDTANDYVTQYTSAEYMNPETGDEYVIPDTTDDYVTQDTSDEYMNPKTSDEYVIQDTVDDYVTQDTSDEYMNPETSDEYVIPETADDYVTQETADEYMNPETADDYTVPATSKDTRDGSPPDDGDQDRTFWEAIDFLFDAYELLDDERKAEEQFKLAYMELSRYETIGYSKRTKQLYHRQYNFGREDRRLAGHQMNDMLVNCSLGGQTCNSSMFTLHQNADYGNCWTISGANSLVGESGPRGGLSLVMYLENHELVDRVTQGHGARLVIHSRNSISVPRSEGIFISAGFQTDIGLRQVEVNRLGNPYGECNSGGVFERHYNTMYTRQGCIRLCEVSKLLKDCGCYSSNDEELVDIIMRNEHSYTHCKTSADLTCVMETQRQMTYEECACDNPCTESVYSRTSSFAAWPSDVYVDVLEKIICRRKDEQACTHLSGLTDTSKKSMNFLKLNVYYEDLNFEVITEVPEITFYQFLSDIGGAVGLWIGLSLISVLEIIQLLIEMYDLAINKSIQSSDKHKERVKLKRSLSNPDADDGIIQSRDVDRAEHTDNKPGLVNRIIAILTRGRTLGLGKRGNAYDYEAAYEPVSVDQQIG